MKEKKLESGLIMGHAYSITDVRMVKILYNWFKFGLNINFATFLGDCLHFEMTVTVTRVSFIELCEEILIFHF